MIKTVWTLGVLQADKTGKKILGRKYLKLAIMSSRTWDRFQIAHGEQGRLLGNEIGDLGQTGQVMKTCGWCINDLGLDEKSLKNYFRAGQSEH